LKHSLQNGNFVDGNALLVDEKRNHSDWTKYMKKLINNPNWAADLGERLYETVKDKYSLDVVTEHRAQIYKSLK
jgi:glycosyltransferase involved in cell wall biosynthesis